jgi:hypothetical protein
MDEGKLGDAAAATVTADAVFRNLRRERLAMTEAIVADEAGSAPAAAVLGSGSSDFHRVACCFDPDEDY